MNIFKKIDRNQRQRLVTAVCLCIVCIGTQRMQTERWDSGIVDGFRDSLGILMAVILFTHYKWSDFLKYRLPYLIWTGAGLTACAVAVPIAASKRPGYLMADTVIIAAGCFLMGYCVIHTVIRIFVEKYRPVCYVPLTAIWVVMLLWMILSKSEYVWPECYFILFLCYYLTEQTSEQRRNVTVGIIDGIILGFIVVQAHALLCRPYDVVRYKGNFCNPNHNCVFLCFCLAALLAKLLFLAKEDGKRLIRIFYFLLTEACYSFIFMTACRSGYLTVFVMTIFFLIAYCRIRAKMIFFRMGALLVALFIAALPVTYLAVRYVPTIHPHVVFYFQEGYNPNWVHSWDERDSEKYITFWQMLERTLWRFQDSVADYETFFGREQGALQERPVLLASRGARLPVAFLTDADKIPALDAQQAGDAFMVRYTIYKWYADHLSLRGMPYDEQGFQLTEGHWIQDTHNIYLDYGINFGWPAMLLFTVFIWWGIGRLTRRSWKARDPENFACLLIVLIPPVFGLFEFAWGAGALYTVAFYLAFRKMMES